MCGRIFQTLPLARLLQIARANACPNQELHSSSFNVCPTTYIPVIRPSRFYLQEQSEQQTDLALEKGEARELAYLKWGVHNSFNMVINGRVEEMLNKQMFLKIIQNRCVVIMEGYYEWNSKKEPFSLRPKEGDHFLAAGLYTDDNEIVILTKDATPELAAVHNRMPVFLSHEEVNLWMNPRNTKDISAILSKSILNKEKQVWKNVGFARVAPHVSNIKEKSIKCLMTIDEYKKELDKTGLMRFWKKAPAMEAVDANGQVIKASVSKVEAVPQKSGIDEPKSPTSEVKLNENSSKATEGSNTKSVTPVEIAPPENKEDKGSLAGNPTP
jgi:putative SOS response-associated peptidase YedK